MPLCNFRPITYPCASTWAGYCARAGQTQAAEELYREGLRYHPTDPTLQLGLAEAYFALGKTSAAFVVVEEL
ncbi:MAG: tetratricopeptide repeat protein [Hymenobacter sp.]